MVNNRLFEALACGAAFLSDHFPELEQLLGPDGRSISSNGGGEATISYHRGPGDAAAIAAQLLRDPASRAAQV